MRTEFSLPLSARSPWAGRRRVLVAGLVAGSAMGLPLSSAAQTYPERAIRFIMPNAPGAATDTVARIFTAKLSELLGQQVLVDNRPGGGGLIAVEVVAKSAPDGYTLLQCGIAQSIRPAMYKKMPFDIVGGFIRVVNYGAVPNVLVVHPSVPVRSLAEFVKLAKANPGKLHYASSGVGLSPHLTMEYFKSLAGIDLLHVPYKSGAQGNSEVLAGQVPTQFANLPSHLPNIKVGKVRALGVTSPKRNAELPDVPTFVESGFPAFDVTVWYGVCAPAKTPAAVIAKFEEAAARVLAAPDLIQKFAGHGVDVRVITGKAFDDFFRSEVARWGKVVRDAGIQPL